MSSDDVRMKLILRYSFIDLTVDLATPIHCQFVILFKLSNPDSIQIRHGVLFAFYQVIYVESSFFLNKNTIHEL